MTSVFGIAKVTHNLMPVAKIIYIWRHLHNSMMMMDRENRNKTSYKRYTSQLQFILFNMKY